MANIKHNIIMAGVGRGEVRFGGVEKDVAWQSCD